jgi:hypothetical protein
MNKDDITDIIYRTGDMMAIEEREKLEKNGHRSKPNV